MANITGLRNDLLVVFDQLKSNEIALEKAAEMNNTAGKIINTVKTQLTYHALRKDTPSIPFLDDTQ